MVFRNRYFQIGAAVLLGILVFALPRPEGTIFEISGDPDRSLAALTAQDFTVVDWERNAGAYRLEATTIDAEPGVLLTAAAAELGDGIEVGYVNGLSPKAFRFLAVLAALIFLFVVEPIPLEITAILIGVCLVSFDIVDVTATWATYMHPVVVFIMCCLILAIALEKAELTLRLSHAIAKRAGTSVIRFTFILSIGLGIGSGLMHDAAATAIGIATMIPLMRAAGIEPNTSTARFMVLSLAFACSCGGMGTLVGGGRNMVPGGLPRPPAQPKVQAAHLRRGSRALDTFAKAHHLDPGGGFHPMVDQGPARH